jgi:hypothetical protein
LLKAAYAKQTELETSLTLAKSNLQMAQANTDVLEDMLRRNTARRSLVESTNSMTSPVDDSKRLSTDVLSLPEGSPVTPASATTPSKSEEGGFFATFGRSRKSTPPALASVRGMNHAASASMPSLVPEGAAAATKQIEDLKGELEGERAKLKKATDEKAALEAELESLSQALFEEVWTSHLAKNDCLTHSRRRTKWSPPNGSKPLRSRRSLSKQNVRRTLSLQH